MDNPGFEVEIPSKIAGEFNAIADHRAYPFEEAVSLTRTGKFHYFLLLVCGFCFLCVMVELLGISIIIDHARCEFGFTVAEQGFLASSAFLGIVLSSHTMGFLADTCGRVKTLKFSLVLSTVSTIISAFSVNIWMLIVFRFFSGFFVCGCQAAVFSLLGEYHGNKTRPRYVTLVSTFLPIGVIYVPATAMLILPLEINATILGVQFSSWRLLLLTNAIIGVVAFIGLTFISESPKFLLIQGHHDKSLEVLAKCYSLNTGRNESEYPVKKLTLNISGANLQNVKGIRGAIALIVSQTIPIFSRELVWQTINISAILFIVYGLSHGTFMWVPSILKEIVQSSDSGLTVCQIVQQISLNTTSTDPEYDCKSDQVDIFTLQVLCLIGVLFMVLYLLFSYTIDIVGKKQLLMIWLVIVCVCCLAMQWANIFIITIITLSLTIAIGNCGGLVTTIAMEYYPTNINAMGMCFIMMIGRLGAVAGSNIVGLLLFDNCESLFYSYSLIITALVFMSYLLPTRQKNEK